MWRRNENVLRHKTPAGTAPQQMTSKQEDSDSITTFDMRNTPILESSAGACVINAHWPDLKH